MNLHELDREVGLPPLPFWQNEIMKSVSQQGLFLRPGIKARHLEGLVRTWVGTLSSLPGDRFDREVRESVGEANTAPLQLLEMIANSYGV